MSGYSYGRVLVNQEFQVCQVSAYASISQGSGYTWIWLYNALWQGSKYAWSTFHKVLDKPGLKIWQGCEYVRVIESSENAWISLNEYVFIVSHYTLTCLINAEYDWISPHIPEKTECWICQNFECVWSSIRSQHKLLSIYRGKDVFRTVSNI